MTTTFRYCMPILNIIVMINKPKIKILWRYMAMNTSNDILDTIHLYRPWYLKSFYDLLPTTHKFWTLRWFNNLSLRFMTYTRRLDNLKSIDICLHRIIWIWKEIKFMTKKILMPWLIFTLLVSKNDNIFFINSERYQKNIFRKDID